MQRSQEILGLQNSYEDVTPLQNFTTQKRLPKGETCNLKAFRALIAN